MKKYLKMKVPTWLVVLTLSLSGLSAGVAAYAAGAGATLVTEDATPPRACTGVQTSGAFGTAQTVLTIPAGPGYIYICSYDEYVGATTAPAATLLNTTTTNLGGIRFASVAAATATSFPGVHFYPAQPLRSAVPGTSVVITGNAAVTSVNYQANVTYFYAP